MSDRFLIELSLSPLQGNLCCLCIDRGRSFLYVDNAITLLRRLSQSMLCDQWHGRLLESAE